MTEMLLLGFATRTGVCQATKVPAQYKNEASESGKTLDPKVKEM